MSNTPSYCWAEKVGRRLTFKLRPMSPCLTGRLLIVHLDEGDITSCQTRHDKDSSKRKNVRPARTERQIIAIFAVGTVTKIEMHARQISFEFADDLALAKHARTFEGLINGICHSSAGDAQQTAGSAQGFVPQVAAS